MKNWAKMLKPLDTHAAYYFIGKALREAPGLSMLSPDALDAIARLAAEALPEEK